MTLVLSGSSLVTDGRLGLPGRLLGDAPSRLLPPVPVPPTSGSFRFLRTQPGSGDPVTFDPCRPVEIRYNGTLAPRGADALVAGALDELSRRTGLALRIAGATDERPTDDRPARDRRYGPGWSPVLLAWSDARETPALAGPVAGLGGNVASAPRLSARLTYVSGSVTLDAPDLAAELESPDGRDRVRAIILHELAHLVGLDHVDDPGELMQPENRGRTSFGPGDLAGLARLGAGRCEPARPSLSGSVARWPG